MGNYFRNHTWLLPPTKYNNPQNHVCAHLFRWVLQIIRVLELLSHWFNACTWHAEDYFWYEKAASQSMREPKVCHSLYATYPGPLGSRESTQHQNISPDRELPSHSSSWHWANDKFETEKRRETRRVKTERKSPKSHHQTPWLSATPAVAIHGSYYTAAGKQ